MFGVRSIFTYSDYRQFLRDYYDERKASDPKFSHRYFAMKAGVRSTGFFSDVLKGKRNLTPSLSAKFSAALKLKKSEAEYFRNLVGYTQSKSMEERTAFYEAMIAAADLSVKKIERDKFEFYSLWYASALRELLYFYDFRGDFDALGRMLNPSISAEDARKGIELLERLQLVSKDANGRYVQATPLITSGCDFRSLYVAQFQRSMMYMAMQAMDRFPISVRDSSTLTLTLSKESFEAAKQEVVALRKRLLALAQKDEKVDRVYQFNLQFFPLSQF